MKKIKSSAWLLVALATVLFVACQKDNIDTSSLIEDPINTDSTRITCDSQVVSIAVQYDSATTVSATLTANRTGGVQPFKYRWSTGDTVKTIRVTNNGTYSVTVTDANGCIVSNTQSIVLTNLCANFRTQIVQVSGTTSLTLNISGGTAPYAYLWSTGAATPSIVSAGSGTYSVTVTDRNGCVAFHQISIGAARCDLFKATINAAFDSLQSTVMWVIPTNGTTPYTYNWSTGATTSQIGVTTTGAYRVTVTDANGCTATDESNINWSSTCPVMTLRFEVFSDSSSSTGRLSAIAGLGTSPYTYRWSTGETGFAISTVRGNTYQVTVTDASGCTISGRKQL